MEYLVRMNTHVPDGTTDDVVQEVRRREASRSRELAAEGSLLRLWRPPLAPGEWRTFGLFAVDNDDELEDVLRSMPLRMWRVDEVTMLTAHPNDPGARAVPAQTKREERPATEYFTWLSIAIPSTATDEVRDATSAGEAERARELAEIGSLRRLWMLPSVTPGTEVLGLWRAPDDDAMQTILASLPMYPWMKIETVPLSPHPSDPELARRPTALGTEGR
jgi:muconolactone delta-isomerase